MQFLEGALDLIIENDIHLSTARISVILLIFFIVKTVGSKVLGQVEKRLILSQVQEGEPPSETAKRAGTLMTLIRQAFRIIIWVILILTTLKEVGVSIGPILASVGVLGLALGFGAQNLVRDFISGFFIILENQVRAGDVAVINGTGGLVERINFRTIVLRDLSGVVHIFPNGAITTLSNLTKDWSAYVFDIGVAYKENTDSVIAILEQVGEELKSDEKIGSYMLGAPEIFGVDKFDDSAVVIKGRIKTQPIRQWDVGREFLRRVKIAFDENGIEIPFPHISVYSADQTKPFEVKMAEKIEAQ